MRKQIENLQSCESLAKLDLTANFVSAPAGLLSVASLRANKALLELYLTGNPCAAHPDYRSFVVASLPQLSKLDGAEVTPSERIAAGQASKHTLRSSAAARRSRSPRSGASFNPRPLGGCRFRAATVRRGARMHVRFRRRLSDAHPEPSPAAVVPRRTPARAPGGVRAQRCLAQRKRSSYHVPADAAQPAIWLRAAAFRWRSASAGAPPFCRSAQCCRAVADSAP